MTRYWLAAVLACAWTSAFAAAGVEGVLKPGEPVVKAFEPLRLGVSERSTARLALPAIGASARKGLESRLAPNQIGISRRDDVDAQPAVSQASLRWQASGGGFAAHIRIASPGAAGLRAGLRFEALPRDLELRVAEAAADGSLRVVAMTSGAELLKLARGAYPVEHWTASTEGVEQVIELWSPRKPAASELRFTLVDISHLLQRPLDPVRAKVLDYACHVDVTCVADANVGNDSKAVAKMLFTKGGRSFVCSGALLNDRASSLTPLFATANHCLSTQVVAASLETWFFYRTSVCNSVAPASPLRLSNGAVLLVADFDTDFALLRLNSIAPGGAFFLGWDPAPLAAGQAIFGIHHPDGSFQRYSSGTFLGLGRVTDSETHITFANVFNRVRYTQGIIEGGSSGSPLLTAPGNFHGTLFGGPSNNSCSGSVFASYSDFGATYRLIKTFLDGPDAADDYGDSPGAAGTAGINTKLVAQLGSDADADWFKFVFTESGQWTVASFDPAPGAGTDVRGEIYGADGATAIASNDDRSDTDLNFEIVRNVTPGTYYLRVTGAPGATGRYGVRSALLLPDDYGNSASAATDLAINGSRSGLLGVVNDQDWFRLTFAEPGTFHVNSTGATDVMGALYQSNGTTLIAENDDIVNGVETNFTLNYHVPAAGVLYLRVVGFDGQAGAYGLQTSFTPGAASASSNFSDIWWGGAAESGWGINLSHQSDTLFATLFTYGSDRSGLWLVATVTRQPNGTFTGPLLRTVGPAFNAAPWTGITATQVGTMTFTFSANDRATLVYSFNGSTVTKSIQRQVFATPVTCSFTTAPRTGATNYQDLWWNPSESGWGINFAHQGNTIFATLFAYGANNRDMWLAATMTRQADGSFSGDLSRTTGPQFDTMPWTAIGVASVGTMRASFANGAAGTLTYTVDGVTVTKPIERQVFGATQSLCQ